MGSISRPPPPNPTPPLSISLLIYLSPQRHPPPPCLLAACHQSGKTNKAVTHALLTSDANDNARDYRLRGVFEMTMWTEVEPAGGIQWDAR